jgi:lipoprotein-anchoring transpeptidase ErfK/SrfK
LAGASLAACSGMIGSRRIEIPGLLPNQFSPHYARMYAAMPEERFPVPAVNLSQLRQSHFRTEVDDPTGEPPGTIVVETAQRYLYLVHDGGRATRYGIGVGRDGFRWAGRAIVGRKAAWPTWTPTVAMMERQPESRQYANGMRGGLDNPLGARALYIYQDGRDTLYRLHGTREVRSIGRAVSSGCVRLLNQDVIDLYRRCPVGTRILVKA